MRILFISSVYPRPSDPVCGVFCQSLCRSLSARHEVRVISPVSWIERVRLRRRFDGAACADGGPSVEHPFYFYPPKVFRSRHGWFMWRSIRSSVSRAIAEFAPDCVLSYWLHPDGDAAVRAARFASIPSAVIVGGSDALLLPRDPTRRRSIEAVLDRADAVITVSQGLKTKVVDLGVDAAKVHVIYQGIDRSLFHPGDRLEARQRLGLPSQQRVLLWVGRMVPVKGLEVLLEACQLLRRKNADFKLCLVGDGPLRPSLAARAAALGIAASVTFVGSQPPSKLPDWYRAADLTVLSSFSEGIPNVLRESLACGTPFASTKVGDVAELCPETTDELVPAGNAAAFADAIAGALEGRATKPKLARLSSWVDYADEIAALLQQLVPTATAERESRTRPLTTSRRV